MSDLVGNPEDRFSHVAAHLASCIFVKKKVLKMLLEVITMIICLDIVHSNTHRKF